MQPAFPEMTPELLAESPQLDAFLGFLQGLGLTSPSQLAELLVQHGHAVTESRWDAFEAGHTVLWIRERLQMEGEPDIMDRVLSCYPGLLMRSVQELEQTVNTLQATGVFESEASLMRLLQTCPGMFIPEVTADMLPVLQCVQKSRKDKYTSSGSYHI